MRLCRYSRACLKARLRVKAWVTKFLAHIREVDAVAQVVRCFEDGNITHVEGSIDPLRDIEIINTELCLADMESVGKTPGKTGEAFKDW